MPFGHQKQHPEPSARESAIAEQAGGIGSLADPTRAEIYGFVVTQNDAVTREAVAEHCGLSLHSARTHLERLVESGLLKAEFRRLSGKSGPGAGRPSKLYARADREFAVSLPERRYDLVGHILASAVVDGERDGVATAQAAEEVAYAEGLSAATATAPARANQQQGEALEQLAEVLRELGYEPQVADGTISLRNCPFDSLAKRHTDLVCGINRPYVQGVCDALAADQFEAVLEPEPGLCCVKIRLR